MTDKEILSLIKEHGFGHREITEEWPAKHRKKLLAGYKERLKDTAKKDIPEAVWMMTYTFEGLPVIERWKTLIG